MDDQACGGATASDSIPCDDQTSVGVKGSLSRNNDTAPTSEGTQTDLTANIGCTHWLGDPQQEYCIICLDSLNRFRQHDIIQPPKGNVVGIDGSERKRDAVERSEQRRDDEVDSSTTDEPTPPDGPFVLFKNVYRDRRDSFVWDTSSYEPVVDEKIDDRQPVFEVVHTFKTDDYYRSTYKRDSPPRSRGAPDKSIVILSRHILSVLRSTVPYYPEVDLDGDSLRLDAPYRILVHHYEELREQQQRALSNEDRTLSRHLELLLDYVDTEVMEDVSKERRRHERGVATFNWLWLLLKPGSDVANVNYTPKSKGGLINRDGAVLAAISGGPASESPEPWAFECWNLTYNGEYLSRNVFTENIWPFDGEIELGRLALLPVDKVQLEDGKPLRERLIEQGKKYYSMLKAGCRHHRGQILEYPFHQLEGQVMIDLPSHIEQDKRGVWASPDRYEYDYLPTRKPKKKDVLGATAFSNYDKLRPETVAGLSDHQHMLCPQRVPAYLFKARAWIYVDVQNLTEAEYRPDLMNTLVLDDKRRRLLTGLAKGFMREETIGSDPVDKHWTADFVKGKGNSQILLLHGQPGVGKTYTAECIAELTRRPLMTLTCSDIGTDPKSVEQNLEANFKLAKRWGAILLIDEADIYLERRHQTDLARNSLVAGFLRALEIYEGMLILTTNRVGAFDDAFISRIHVKLYYPSLSREDRQKLWNNFMTKLRDERGQEMRIMEDAEDFIESAKVQNLQLNGREIRNIFQTAVGLADYEEDRDAKGRIKLKREHIAQVAEMSWEFKEYLNTLLVGDENQRAEKSFLRVNDTLVTTSA